MEATEIKLKIHWPQHRQFCIMDNISDPGAFLIYAEDNAHAVLLATIEICNFFKLPKEPKYTQKIISEIKQYFTFSSPDFQTITVLKSTIDENE